MAGFIQLMSCLGFWASLYAAPFHSEKNYNNDIKSLNPLSDQT